ncbi:sigma-E processing peptidase SpoIIGA [Clostridium zeae]|uniref:Sporulation sigma-E factor-processing peptidase n=1 Tax=Clostridium zeae TaxID=2759022 RepID=A0ABQ1E9J1_9CLOT|nr:sigma-E processing peptidase SpoIIGA [Clostridium zeae]GFZ31441.1 sigma-E processing peptidase SpoIIGA [Clostridium zeae]
MKVYVDVILLENFVINLFLITITLQTVRIKFSFVRASLGSILGAFYTLLYFFPSLSVAVSLPVKLLIPLIMIFITLGRLNFLVLIKSTGIFLLWSILLCGFIFAFSLMNNPYDLFSAFTLKNIYLKYMLLALMIIYVFAYRTIIFIRDRKSLTDFFYEIEFSDNSKNFRVKAFLDSGNELTEPATTLPVILINKNYLEGFSGEGKGALIVPYKVINGGKGSLEGFRMNQIKLYKDDKLISTKDAVICLCKDQFSPYDDYGALLSRGVL